jgi:hypothetical protein
MPNERAARLMLSNWATLTNVRTSSRFAIGVTLPLLEIGIQSLRRAELPRSMRLRVNAPELEETIVD